MHKALYKLALIGNLFVSSVTYAQIPAINFSPISVATQAPLVRWVGQTAPEFKLQDQKNQWHRLKQYKGKWLVLYFYPQDNSSGCILEAKEFKNLYPNFQKNNTAVLGVSLNDVKSHQAFSTNLNLPFPLLADDQHQLANQFDIVRGIGALKFAKRETFLIDPNGVIVYHYTGVNSQSHASNVLRDILRFQQKNTVL